MRKLMPLPMVNSNEWIASLQVAIHTHDSELLQKLLQTLPVFQNSDEQQQVLLLTMDAENMLCELRQELVNQRETIISQNL